MPKSGINLDLVRSGRSGRSGQREISRIEILGFTKKLDFRAILHESQLQLNCSFRPDLIHCDSLRGNYDVLHHWEEKIIFAVVASYEHGPPNHAIEDVQVCYIFC